MVRRCPRWVDSSVNSKVPILSVIKWRLQTLLLKKETGHGKIAGSDEAGFGVEELQSKDTVLLFGLCKELCPPLSSITGGVGDPEIWEYLHYLIKDKEVSQSAVNQTYSALKFLYETTLKRDWDGFRIPRAKMSKRLPVILSQQEMEVSFFGHRESKASSDLDDDLFGGFEAERGGSFKGIGYR